LLCGGTAAAELCGWPDIGIRQMYQPFFHPCPILMRPFLLFVAAALLSLPATAQKVVSKQKPTVQKVKIKQPAPKKAAKKPVAAAKPAPAEAPVLTFDRTPCFGACPVYSMQVFADGRVAYEGKRGVPMLGKKELHMPANTLAEILNKAKEVHFTELQDRYSQNTSDLPSTVVSIRQASGKVKTVIVEEGAPDAVNQYFAYLTRVFDRMAEINPER